MSDLSGKSTIVVGASRGLGRGFTGAGTSANSAVTRRSISSTFTSPTTITAMRSGRYQSR